ncbi:MAG: hypothetical protein FRX49_03335 [Trebouxia sp. A1-2]|nr:MAG: hypothetical protein FRX49_03335 [Trebouxia sp. A1-2]
MSRGLAFLERLADKHCAVESKQPCIPCLGINLTLPPEYQRQINKLSVDHSKHIARRHVASAAGHMLLSNASVQQGAQQFMQQRNYYIAEEH